MREAQIVMLGLKLMHEGKVKTAAEARKMAREILKQKEKKQ